MIPRSGIDKPLPGGLPAFGREPARLATVWGWAAAGGLWNLLASDLTIPYRGTIRLPPIGVDQWIGPR